MDSLNCNQTYELKRAETQMRSDVISQRDVLFGYVVIFFGQTDPRPREDESLNVIQIKKENKTKEIGPL